MTVLGLFSDCSVTGQFSDTSVWIATFRGFREIAFLVVFIFLHSNTRYINNSRNMSDEKEAFR